MDRRKKISFEGIANAVPQILEQDPSIRLLVLFGSRARSSSIESSDWDFAFLCDNSSHRASDLRSWNLLRIFGILQEATGLSDDRLDVVDMASCSELLAHNISRDGKVIYEKSTGVFKRFQKIYLKTPESLKRYEKETQSEIERILQELQR